MSTGRQSRILDHVARQGEASVEELSQLVQVSPSTIRRELESLEKSGMLVRTHGGAEVRTPLHYEPPFESRASVQVEAKRDIAMAARELIQPNAIVGISGGTTCTELARQLRFLHSITVVTNAINIALELYGQSNKRLVVTGGILNQDSYELVGDLALESLENLHCDIAFLGVSGIDAAFGFSMADEPEAAVGKKFLAAASKKVILAGSAKMGKVTFARLCRLNQVDTLITDSGADAAYLARLRQTGLQVLVAGHGNGATA